MIFTHQTNSTCVEIEERIEEEAKSFGLMMKKHFPFSKNLPEAGFEIKEYASVFELCNPSVASKLLNIQPELCVLMPCRICVFEKGGVAFVSTPDIEFALKIIGCDAALEKEIIELYNNITSMMKKW